MSDFWLGIIDRNIVKHLKTKMLVVLHPTNWYDWSMPENKKKET